MGPSGTPAILERRPRRVKEGEADLTFPDYDLGARSKEQGARSKEQGARRVSDCRAAAQAYRGPALRRGSGSRTRRRRRPWSAEACFRFRFARRTHTDSHSRAAEPSPPKLGEPPQTEASPEKAVASYRSPKRLRRGGGAAPSRPAALHSVVLRRRRRPWSAEACFRFRFDRRTHTASHSRAAESSPPKLGEHPQTEASPQKAAASYRSPKRLRRGGGAAPSKPAALLSVSSDAAGVLGARKLASAFDSPGAPTPTRTAEPPSHPRRSPGSPRKPRPLRRKRQQATAVQSGCAAVPGQFNLRPVAPLDCISDAAGVLGVRKLASAFGSPWIFYPVLTWRPGADGELGSPIESRKSHVRSC